MKKVPEEEIKRIKASTDLLTEVTQRGIELKKKGKEYVGLCPFHSEKTPSFHINPIKQEWHCFGCDEGGDVFEFIMKYDKKDFREVLQDLAGSPQTPTVIKPKDNPQSTPSDLKPSSQNDLINVVNYYHQTLISTPSALAYLQSRGLNHLDLISTFKLGFSNRSLGKTLPKNNKDLRNQLKAHGIFRADGKEHFIGCLTFPIFCEDGSLGEIYGRRTSRTRQDSSPHLYLPGPHQGVFNQAMIGHDSPLILCESIIDALSFWVHGFTHVTASFGAPGFNEEMLHLFKARHIKTVWIAYDNDDRGNQHAEALAPKLQEAGMEVERILLPKSKDVNQWMLESNTPQKVLGELLEQRQSYPPLKAGQAKKKHPGHWDGQDLLLELGNRHYRVRGIDKIRSLSTLKVQIKVDCGDLFFIDSLDLTVHRQRQAFINGTSEELQLEKEVIKRELGKIYLQVETLVDELLHQKEEPTEPLKTLSPQEMEAALNFLKSKDLIHQILQDFETIGLIGEESNKLVG